MERRVHRSKQSLNSFPQNRITVGSVYQDCNDETKSSSFSASAFQPSAVSVENIDLLLTVKFRFFLLPLNFASLRSSHQTSDLLSTQSKSLANFRVVQMSGLVWLLVCGRYPFLGDAHKPVRGAVQTFIQP